MSAPNKAHFKHCSNRFSSWNTITHRLGRSHPATWLFGLPKRIALNLPELPRLAATMPKDMQSRVRFVKAAMLWRCKNCKSGLDPCRKNASAKQRTIQTNRHKTNQRNHLRQKTLYISAANQSRGRLFGTGRAIYFFRERLGFGVRSLSPKRSLEKAAYF